MRWPALAPAVLGLTFAYLALGTGSCEGQAGPELVKVFEVTPREVEVGDRVALVGEGFPPGKPARILFRGTLHRPGEGAVESAEIVARGEVVRPDQVELAFDETALARFCGAGDRAVHTTFEGDVVVSFASAGGPSAPPVTGALRHVVFDVRPPASPADGERVAEGERALDFFGIGAAPTASGLLVDSVRPGSRAEAAQVEAGDVMVTFDGVRVATAADVVPPPGEREASVGVRHAGSAAESPRTVVVDGFRRAAPTELFGAALIVLASVLALLLFASPLPAGAASAMARAIEHIRARANAAKGRSRAPAWRAVGAAFASVAHECLPEPGAAALPDAVVCAVLAVLPFGQYLVASQLDVGLLFVTAATCLAAWAFVASRSAWEGVCAAGLVVWEHVPAAVAVVAAVVATGSFRVQEIERAQGGWPWEWLAFRDPAALLALALLVAAGDVPLLGSEAGGRLVALVEREGTADDGNAARGVSREGPGAWGSAARRVHRLVMGGLASTLFLGGWLLPGVAPASQDARPWLELLGAGVLLAKTVAVAVGICALRAFGPRLSPATRARVTLLRGLPLALGGLAATVGWSVWGPGPAIQRLVSCGLVVAAVLASAAVAHRIRYGVEGPEARLSPFL